MIILFDVDSTISTIEGCDMLAEKKGVGEQVKSITKATMDGDLDFDTAFPKKLELLSPSVSEIQWLSQHYCHHISTGAVELIEKMLSSGHQVGILSHGYKYAILPMAADLGISEDWVYALEFTHDEKGQYLKLDDTLVVGESGKAKVIHHLKERYPDQKVLFVGDSASDLKAGDSADIFIGYGGVVERAIMKQKSKNYIYELRKLEEYLV